MSINTAGARGRMLSVDPEPPLRVGKGRAMELRRSNAEQGGCGPCMRTENTLLVVGGRYALTKSRGGVDTDTALMIGAESVR